MPGGQFTQLRRRKPRQMGLDRTGSRGTRISPKDLGGRSDPDVWRYRQKSPPSFKVRGRYGVVMNGIFQGLTRTQVRSHPKAEMSFPDSVIGI